MFRQLQHLIALVPFVFVDSLVRSAKKYERGTLLLIRIDPIGDYILFRNFIKSVRESPKFRNYRITFLGNTAWKQLALELDGQYVDEFIWLDRHKFKTNLRYRYLTLQTICQRGYEIVVSSAFGREFYFSDWIVRNVFAEKKIGTTGGLCNISGWQKFLSDKWYTQLLRASDPIMFEFYRNREFFSALLEQPQEHFADRPSIELQVDQPAEIGRYAVLFLGAGEPFRKWPVDYFAHVAQHLTEKHDLQIVLCGGKSEVEDAEQFQQAFGYNCRNLVGKTTLPQMMQVIAGSRVLVSNESSAPHIAMALGRSPVLVVSPGRYYGRFAPYPDSFASAYQSAHPPAIECRLDEFEDLCKQYSTGTSLRVDEIRVDVVLAKLDKLLTGRASPTQEAARPQDKESSLQQVVKPTVQTAASSSFFANNRM